MTCAAATTAGAERAVGLRGLVVGAVLGLGSVLAHALSAPGPVGLVAPAVVVLAALLLGPVLVRRASLLPGLAGGALALPLLAHTSMALGAMPTGGDHAAGGSPLTAALAMVLEGGVPMLVGHVAIAITTAVLARGADRALVSLLQDWLQALLLPQPSPCAVPEGRRARAVAGPPRPRSREHRTAAGPRAPPVWSRTPAVPA